MEYTARSDSYWKRRLSKTAYQALREGSMEPVGTGAYVDTHEVGTYYCRGCGSALFHSDDKVDDGSGYAAFRAPTADGVVMPIRTYTDKGNELTSVICTTCNGTVGGLADVEVRSAQSLELGTHEHLYHISSHAVHFKKKLCFRNYPLGAMLLLVFVVGSGYAVWLWGVSFLESTQLKGEGAYVSLWLDADEIQTTVIHLNDLETLQQPLFSGGRSILLVYANVSGTPQIRFTNHPVDIIWFDSGFVVMGSEQDMLFDVPRPLEAPPSVHYALITEAGSFDASRYATGTEFYIDKLELFRNR